MSIEEAYSKEIDDIIDAEKAYELYWDGEIEDKTAFNCICCNAKITCANLDKERVDMKTLPHFRCIEGHKDYCYFTIEEKNIRNTNGKSKKRYYIDEDIDTLDIKINLLGSTKGIQDDIGKKIIIDRNKIRENILDDYKNGTRRKADYHSIRPIVSKYHKYIKDGSIKAKFLNVYKGKNNSKNDINICYEEMFVDITKIDINDISKYKRIYYGLGKIYKVKENYMIQFDIGFRKGDRNIRTAFFINTKYHLSRLKNYSQWKERLDSIANKKNMFMIYIYTKDIKENTYKNNDNELAKVINFSLDNIGCFDYRKIKND